MTTRQRGGTIVGFIFGLIVGLGVALAVVVYVMKVPVPFITKGGLRGPEQDAAEAEKNRNWNPNHMLAGKPAPARPAEPAAPAASEAVAPTPSKVAEPKPDAKDAAKDAVAKNAKDKDANKPAASADPLGDFAKAKASTATAEPFEYFVQAGAFNTQQDADAQRAKLAMLGWEARVSEREQNGRAYFRVRVGPFAKRDDAEQLKDKLKGAGVESTLVRVQR
ncbi:cell division protein FtsN [Paenacidovorax caeni]|uniref:Cell division protein FtsN n=1 Tax=Paenacidovorax caeni TaxID=343013 RepID=A0A1I7IQ62_9BURK|nr:SPOR domain-containing protein [Paenacidovorax caeni]SFU75037.1 cell division protein FtsN [Paenacidovorax caeni]